MIINFLTELHEGLNEDVNSSNLDWLKEQFLSDLKSSTRRWASNLEVKSAEAIDNSSLKVKATITLDLGELESDMDFDDLYGDDFDGYSVPDDAGEKFIENLNEDLVGELIFTKPDDIDVIYECELEDYTFDNDTYVKIDSAPRTYDDPGYFDWEINGYFEIDVEFKLAPKAN